MAELVSVFLRQYVEAPFVAAPPDRLASGISFYDQVDGPFIVPLPPRPALPSIEFAVATFRSG
jgi:hypothetical protein